MIHIDGSWTGTQKKPCKHCKHFLLWGTSIGYCMRRDENFINCREHCKYFKRDYESWTKDGKCKVEEWMLYC